MNSKDESRWLKWTLGVGLVLLVAFGVYRKRTMQQIVVQITQQATTATQPTSTHTSPKNVPEGSTFKISQPSHQGLCRYQVGGNQALLTLRDFQQAQLNFQTGRLLALPSFNGNCLRNLVGSFTARIVSYDPLTDLAYDYWGTATLSLQFEAEAPSLHQLLTDPRFNHKLFGFTSEQNFASHLLTGGATPTDAFIVFKVESIRDAAPRTPAGSYAFYPGVRIKKIKEIAQPATFIDSGVAIVPEVNSPKAFRLEGTALNSRQISNPSALAQTAQADLSQLPKQSELILFGIYPGDRKPFNLASVLQKAGFTNLTVLEEGYAGFANWQTETPVKLPDLRSITLSELAQQFTNYLILDTRERSRDGAWDFAPSLLAPVIYRGEAADPTRLSREFTQYHTQKYFTLNFDLGRRLDLEAISRMARTSSRRILLLGRDEYDWRPIVLFEALKQKGVRGADWLRGGMESLVVAKQLGAVDKSLAEQIVPSVTMTTIAEKGARPGSGIALTVQPTRRTKQSFEKPR